MSPTLRRVRTALVYFAAVAAFFEVFARLAMGTDTLFSRLHGQDSASWRLRFVKRQARGRGLLYYGFDVHHPVRGWALRPGVRDPNAYGGRGLTSNSEGVRGAREYARPKPRGVQRILVLGDSFTFGEEVGDEETYSHHLAASLPGVEVINLGVHGYGHDQMLLYLKEVGARYQPDVVLLGFLSDDMERNLLSFRDFAKPHYVRQGDGLRLEGPPIPTPEEALAAEWKRSKFADLVTMLRDGWQRRSGAHLGHSRRLIVAILDEMARTIETLGARPAYAYLPVYGEIDKPDMAMTRREHFFFGYCRDRGIQSMYLRRFFRRKLQQGVEFKTYGHWGQLEHRTAAEGMRAYLLEKGLVRLGRDKDASATSAGPGPGADHQAHQKATGRDPLDVSAYLRQNLAERPTRLPDPSPRI